MTYSSAVFFWLSLRFVSFFFYRFSRLMVLLIALPCLAFSTIFSLTFLALQHILHAMFTIIRFSWHLSNCFTPRITNDVIAYHIMPQSIGIFLKTLQDWVRPCLCGVISNLYCLFHEPLVLHITHAIPSHQVLPLYIHHSW